VPLDPQARSFLDGLPGVPRYDDETLEEGRLAAEEGAAALFGPFDEVPYEDRVAPGPAGPVPIRVYTPPATDPGVLVYFHGGGWVRNSVATVHGVCATLAREAACVVVSVEYRRAPEHPFPAALEDAWAVTEWLARHPDAVGAPAGALAQAPAAAGARAGFARPRCRLAVGGDSAGGNLAAVCARRARDTGILLGLQLLVYPVCDADLETPSYRAFADGYWLTRDGMRWFWEKYVPEGDHFHPDASPLRAANLTGLAPALVLTAEYDVLRDEGEAYARRLGDAGVPVALSRYDGLIHGFFRMPGVLDRARNALAEAAVALRTAFV
jgi:acetyl esterase